MRQIKPVFMRNALRIAPPSLTTTLKHISDQIRKFTKIAPLGQSPLTEPIFAHFFKISFQAAMRQIKPIFVQNAFRMAPPSLTTTLEHISDQIKKFTKIDPLMMLTSNFPFEISLMICEIWGCPSVETLLLVLASGV